MKRILIIFILILSIFSITNAYSEEMHKEYYDSGKILKESYFSNDKKNGKEKTYYENGQISSIKNYKDGVVDGEYIEYYSDGKLKLKGSYKNGLREGEFKTYLINSKSAGSIFYKDGKIIKSTLTPYMKEDVFFNYSDKTEAQIDIRDKKDGYYHMYYLNYLIVELNMLPTMMATIICIILMVEL